MKIEEVVKLRIENLGLRYDFVSQQSGIPLDKLRLSIKQKRKLKPEELIKLCFLLNLGVNDFIEEPKNKAS